MGGYDRKEKFPYPGICYSTREYEYVGTCGRWLEVGVEQQRKHQEFDKLMRECSRSRAPFVEIGRPLTGCLSERWR